VNVEDYEAVTRSLIGIAGAIGGLWFILRMALTYQRDFTDQYSSRIKEQDLRIDALEDEIDELRAAQDLCHQENARMRYALIANGITIPGS